MLYKSPPCSLAGGNSLLTDSQLPLCHPPKSFSNCSQNSLSKMQILSCCCLFKPSVTLFYSWCKVQIPEHGPKHGVWETGRNHDETGLFQILFSSLKKRRKAMRLARARPAALVVRSGADLRRSDGCGIQSGSHRFQAPQWFPFTYAASLFPGAQGHWSGTGGSTRVNVIRECQPHCLSKGTADIHSSLCPWSTLGPGSQGALWV